MKRPLAILALAALFTGMSADDADAQKVKKKFVNKTVHRNHFGQKVVHKQKFVKVRRNGFARHRGFRPGFGFGVSIGAPVIHRPVVVPAFTFVNRQIWVPEQTERVVVGYTACGNPIVDAVVVQPGFYRTARYKVYPTGSQVFVGYVN